MTRIRPFLATDIVALDLQGSQRGTLGIYDPEISLRHGYMLRDAGLAMTAVDAAGRVLAAGGLLDVFGDRQATAWAAFAEGWWDQLDRRKVLRALRAGISGAPHARIEALARAAQSGECRLLEACGFRRVVELEQWGPKSETVVLYEKLGRVSSAGE
jgi:hypothetical protein